MLYDRLDDPDASMSFSGVLLQPGDLSPRLTLLGGPVVRKAAARKQKKLRRTLVDDPARVAR